MLETSARCLIFTYLLFFPTIPYHLLDFYQFIMNLKKYYLRYERFSEVIFPK